MNHSRGTHGHLFLLVLALAVAAVVAALYGYMRYAIGSSVSRAILAREIVRLKDADKSRADEVMQLYQSTAADRARLSGFFIPADDVVSFIEAVEAIGPQSGAALTLSSIGADAPSKPAPGAFGSARAKVEAHGSWQAVMKALKLAESLPYDITIDNVRLDGSLQPSGRGTIHSWSLSYDLSASLVASSTVPSP